MILLLTIGCPLYVVECQGEKIPTSKECFPDPTPYLGGCEPQCPVVCGANETVCNFGTDANGCSLGGICVPDTGLNQCDLCPEITCGGNTKICPSVENTLGCSQETCSLPLVGICPDEAICSPDCPFDHIPCFAPR